MYLLAVVLLLGVFPFLSVGVEFYLERGNFADLAFLIGKWFVFWSVGVRLLLAGVRQTINPAFTSETIFAIKEPAAQKIVRELGIGNLAIGLLGVLTIYERGWIVPAAITGGLFYGLAGVRHLLNRGRNRNENIATVSDLLVFVVLAVYLVAAFLLDI